MPEGKIIEMGPQTPKWLSHKLPFYVEQVNQEAHDIIDTIISDPTIKLPTSLIQRIAKYKSVKDQLKVV